MRKIAVWTVILLLSLALAAPGVSWAGRQVPRVDKDTLKSWLADPQVLIIDVRAGSSWEKSDKKIKGAVRQDPQKVKTWAASLPKDKKIVLY